MADSEVVQKLLREGYAFPCAFCKKLWKAKAKGFDECVVAFMPEKSCGGPIAGMSFPMYEGPLSITALATRCFRCGEPAVEAVTSRLQPTRYIGVCKKHLLLLERLVPVDDSLKDVG